MNLNPPPAIEHRCLPRHFAIKALSEHLGVPQSTLRLHLTTGKLKGRKIGRRWMVAEDDVIDWLDREGRINLQSKRVEAK